ncbi:Carbohydrate esterase family 4 protein [Mycena indigotica]|uniref:chitin deacetylase n=1 Tax=Mycena indigotica TaxID=2126181 RepID=A0A8H6TE41_9AGAR|nr:Carbohydrate esterase family 4 protein [Mycena indigotica]KAF7314997.1 Carbohydrate esterase family 4 protein [Mycena indigotica]
METPTLLLALLEKWSKGFPKAGATPNNIPDIWTAALKAAADSKLIPNIPVAYVDPNLPDGEGIPTYPKGHDPNSAEVCSATAKCKIPGDIWDAPEGQLALSFDDGPTDATADLLDFLKANGQTTTHFMIGSNILSSPNAFSKAFDLNNDIAGKLSFVSQMAHGEHSVHTWSHPFMTTLSNEKVVAELGWTMQLIHDSTGGRVPRFWRPPFGDSDVRTRAIAKEVFGLTTVIWNKDTSDWGLTDKPPSSSLSKINASMTQWLTAKSKSPGLVILEHELTSQSVQAFKSAYPVMKSNNWNVVSLAQLFGNGNAYLNAADNRGAVPLVTNIANAKNGNPSISQPLSLSSTSGRASTSKGGNSILPTSSTRPLPSSSAASRGNSNDAERLRAAFHIWLPVLFGGIAGLGLVLC